jgi:hypothetical protein
LASDLLRRIHRRTRTATITSGESANYPTPRREEPSRFQRTEIIFGFLVPHLSGAADTARMTEAPSLSHRPGKPGRLEHWLRSPMRVMVELLVFLSMFVRSWFGLRARECHTGVEVELPIEVMRDRLEMIEAADRSPSPNFTSTMSTSGLSSRPKARSAAEPGPTPRRSLPVDGWIPARRCAPSGMTLVDVARPGCRAQPARPPASA